MVYRKVPDHLRQRQWLGRITAHYHYCPDCGLGFEDGAWCRCDKPHENDLCPYCWDADQKEELHRQQRNERSEMP